MQKNVQDAAYFLYSAGWPIRLNSVGAMRVSEADKLAVKDRVENRYELAPGEYDLAIKEAERMDALDAEMERQYFRAHPELNP